MKKKLMKEQIITAINIPKNVMDDITNSKEPIKFSSFLDLVNQKNTLFERLIQSIKNNVTLPEGLIYLKDKLEPVKNDVSALLRNQIHHNGSTEYKPFFKQNETYEEKMHYRFSAVLFLQNQCETAKKILTTGLSNILENVSTWNKIARFFMNLFNVRTREQEVVDNLMDVISSANQEINIEYVEAGQPPSDDPDIFELRGIPKPNPNRQSANTDVKNKEEDINSIDINSTDNKIEQVIKTLTKVENDEGNIDNYLTQEIEKIDLLDQEPDQSIKLTN